MQEKRSEMQPLVRSSFFFARQQLKVQRKMATKKSIKS